MNMLMTPAAVQKRSRGRAYFWAGIGVCLLGIVLMVVQYSLKQLFVPWYVAVAATLGVLLQLCALARRRSIVRVIVLLLITALAGFEWLFLVSLSKLPAYEGPAQVGRPLPAFRTTLADGSQITEKDLQQGKPSVLVFFRGHW